MTGTYVKCIYKFDGEVESDLLLDVGDLVKVTKVISDDWYEGTINGATGQFPKAFVEDTSIDQDQEPKNSNKSMEVFDMAIAVNSFSAEQDGDLPLNEGEVVVITEIVNEDWAVGYTHGGHKGTFPRIFVKQISFENNAMKNALHAVVPSFEVEKGNETNNEVLNDTSDRYLVIDPFFAQGDNELNLKKGDIVIVVGVFDDFWLEGKLDNGKTGIFPRTCVDFPEEKMIEILDSKESDKFVHNDDVKILQFSQAEPEQSQMSYAVALFNYNSTVEGDLNFKIGDKIKLISIVDQNWYRGELSGIEGVFPANHVKKVERNDNPLSGSPPVNSAVEVNELPENDSFPFTPEDAQSDIEEKSDELKEEEYQPEFELSQYSHQIDAMIHSKIPQKWAKNPPPSRPKKPAKPKPSLPAKFKITTAEEKKPKKKPPPERPKMPATKKDTASAFSYKFDTDSQPLVIISGKYLKEGEPNVIILRRTLRS